MKRRDVITVFGFLSLGGAAVLWRNLAAFWRPGTSEHVERTVGAIADLIIFGDGLPAASQLGLHQRVLSVPDVLALAADGVSSLDRRAAAQGATNFLALGEARQFALLDAVLASGDGDVPRFLLLLRFHLMTAYYAEPVVKRSFAYTGPPQPDGFADFQERPA